MKEKVNYKAIGKGLYKIAFSLCIIILCVITVVITGNYNKSTTTDLELENSEINVAYESVAGDANSSDKEYFTENVNPNKDKGIQNKNENEISLIYTPDFIPPVSGDVLKDFSDKIPIYSKTMDDWRIHSGIDILCPYGTEVLSCEKGTVTDVGYDMLFGNYVEVSLNDFTLRYTSLEAGITHSVGDEINKGDVIGYLSDSCISEVCDKPHLHFEMKKSGEYVNPREFIY
ncbi:MAG: M23 family metallopeptidase [Ruminococcaceae bacterium]|nr:M23 family metallopeptidase [Oscillospiraceae bacterium]